MTVTAMKKSIVREYAESLIIAVILALFVRTWVFQAFKIPTGSMENNLLIGDHLLVNKFVFSPTASSLERALMPIGTIKRGGSCPLARKASAMIEPNALSYGKCVQGSFAISSSVSLRRRVKGFVAAVTTAKES